MPKPESFNIDQMLDIVRPVDVCEFLAHYCTFNEIIGFGRQNQRMQTFLNFPENHRRVFGGLLERDMGISVNDHDLTQAGIYRRLYPTYQFRCQVKTLSEFKADWRCAHYFQQLSDPFKKILDALDVWGALPILQQAENMIEHQAYFARVIAALARIKLRHGETALLLASLYGYDHMVRLLVAADSPLNVKGPFDTPLIGAARAGHHRIVQLLVDAGASLNEQSFYDFTALIAAAESGHAEIVETLVNAGADLNKTTTYGVNALGYAERKNYVRIAEVLREAMYHPKEKMVLFSREGEFASSPVGTKRTWFCTLM